MTYNYANVRHCLDIKPTAPVLNPPSISPVTTAHAATKSNLAKERQNASQNDMVYKTKTPARPGAPFPPRPVVVLLINPPPPPFT
jgi:hypothetical protein